MVMIFFFMPFQGGGIQHLLERGVGGPMTGEDGGCVELPYRYYWDTCWAFQRKENMYIRLLMSDMT